MDLKLKGDQSVIRFLEEADAESLLDLHVRNKEFFQKTSPTFDDGYYTLAFTRKHIRRSEEQGEHYSFGIFLNGSGKLIGTVSLFLVLRVHYRRA